MFFGKIIKLVSSQLPFIKIYYKYRQTEECIELIEFSGLFISQKIISCAREGHQWNIRSRSPPNPQHLLDRRCCDKLPPPLSAEMTDWHELQKPNHLLSALPRFALVAAASLVSVGCWSSEWSAVSATRSRGCCFRYSATARLTTTRVSCGQSRILYPPKLPKLPCPAYLNRALFVVCQKALQFDKA